MVKFFNRSLIFLIISFPILYSSNTNAAKLTCECIYSSQGNICLSEPPIEIQTFLYKNYIKVDGLIYEIFSKNEDKIIATNTTNLSYGNFMMTINRNSGQTQVTFIFTEDTRFNDGSIKKKGHTISWIYKCKKKDKLF